MTEQIVFSNALFGRGNERKKILSLLRLSAAGNFSCIFISGAPGTGKTFLARSIIDETRNSCGIFASGKFDQYNRDIPYGAFANALKIVVKSLLLVEETRLNDIRNRIIKVLSPNTGIITGMVPELEHIIGKQSPPPEIHSGNTVLRFKHCICEFISIAAAFCSPLVIFIDDIQWADSASIDLIRYLADKSAIKGLFLILALRDYDEIKKLVSEIDNADILNIRPLSKKHAETLITSALNGRPGSLKKVSSIIYNKTLGNPFYVYQFLQSLVSNGSLYRITSGQWAYNEESLEKEPASENVADLIASKLRASLQGNLVLLSTAACIGNVFDAVLIEEVSDLPDKRDVFRTLNYFVGENYLFKINNTYYSFVHDKVREAAYDLLSTEDKELLHWKIAGALLKTSAAEDDNVFVVADHLNKSGVIPADSGFAKQQIDFNIKAGLKARDSTAFDAAMLYFEIALSLADGKYCSNNRLLFTIRKNYAETVFLCGKFGQVQHEITEALRYSPSPAESSKLYNTLVLMKTMEGRYNEALDFGVTALEGIGFFIERTSAGRKKQVRLLQKKASLYLRGISIDRIVNLPECKDENTKCAFVLLINMGAALFHLADWEYIHLLLTMVIILSFETGVAPGSCSGFSGYAYLQSAVFGKYALSCIIGEAAWILADRFGNPEETCIVSVQYANLIMYWKYHLKESIRLNKIGFEAGLKAGSYLYASYSVAHSSLNILFLGIKINSALKIIEQGLEYLERMNDKTESDVLKSIRMHLLDASFKTAGQSYSIYPGNDRKRFR